LLPFLNEAAARIGVVGSQLLLDLADVQSVGDQFFGVYADLVFTRGPAKAGNVHDVRNRFELFLQGPVFDGFQFHQVVLRVGAAKRVPVNLAHGTPIRAHLRLEAIGQGDLREPFEDFFAIPIVAGFIVEDESNAGQTKKGERAQMREMRNAVHLNLDGNGDLLLDFFRGSAGPLGDDLRVIVSDVGVGFHGKVME